MTGMPVASVDDALRAGEALMARGAANVVITLGGRGALIRGEASPGTRRRSRPAISGLDRSRRRLLRRVRGRARRGKDIGRGDPIRLHGRRDPSDPLGNGARHAKTSRSRGADGQTQCKLGLTLRRLEGPGCRLGRRRLALAEVRGHDARAMHPVVECPLLAQSHRSPIESFLPDTDRSAGKIPVARRGCAMITGLLNAGAAVGAVGHGGRPCPLKLRQTAFLLGSLGTKDVSLVRSVPCGQKRSGPFVSGFR